MAPKNVLISATKALISSVVLGALICTVGCGDDSGADTDDTEGTDESHDAGDVGDAGSSSDTDDAGDVGEPGPSSDTDDVGDAGSSSDAGGGGDIVDAGNKPIPTSPGPGDNIFTDDQVLEIRLNLRKADWDHVEEFGNDEEYVPASVEIKGQGFETFELPEVGLRHKGAYSLHHCWDQFGGVRSRVGNCQKLSYKLKFDWTDEAARFDGLKRLNLHAGSVDHTKLLEFLAYSTFRDFGIAAPRVVPVRLIINGKRQGLFLGVEEVDGRFAKSHFPAGGGDGNLYKEVWPHPEQSEEIFLSGLDTNVTELADGGVEGDVSGILAFSKAIGRSDEDDFLERVEPYIDVDQFLRYLAIDRAIKNWDSVTALYVHGDNLAIPHNYYWYHDQGGDGRFHLIPWDMDNTFAAADWLAGKDPYIGGINDAPPIPNWNSQPYECVPRPIWSANSGETILPSRCDPFLDLLARTSWDRFVEIGEELIAGPLSEKVLGAKLAHRKAQIKSLIEEDPYVDYSTWLDRVNLLEKLFPRTRNDFQHLLDTGLIEEESPYPPEDLPAAETNTVVTEDTGVHPFGVTNFEFANAPTEPWPATVWSEKYGGSELTLFAASWSDSGAIRGNADLRFDFTYFREPGAYNEGAVIHIGTSEPADVSEYKWLKITLSANPPRVVRVRVNGTAYNDLWGGISSNFQNEQWIDSEPTVIAIKLAALDYPSWAGNGWSTTLDAGQLAEARQILLQSFTGLAFEPIAKVDGTGELLDEDDGTPSYIRIDNIYFQ